MRGTTIPLLTVATSLLSIAPTAFAGNSKAIPCVIGNGEEALCDSCEEDKAIEVTAWSNATWAKDFKMPKAPSQTGPGYDVYWKIEEPAEGCRIMLFEPFNTDKGSINPKIPGTIVLSVNHGGCYMVTVGSRGVAAGACCGDECANIGAIPSTASKKVKRELLSPPSRVARSMLATKVEPRVINVDARDDLGIQDKVEHQNAHRTAEPKLVRRGSGGQNPDPFHKKPEAPKPVWNCKAEKKGPSYSKSGIQQVDGRNFPCRTLGCDMTMDFTITTSSSVSSEKSTTFTNSEGFSVDVTVGWMYAGPTATTTIGYNKEFSEALSSSTGLSQTDTNSTSVSWRQQVMPGATYNGWMAPYLICQIYSFSCNDGKEQADMEKCEPWLDGSGKPVGEQSVMTTGSA
ncbi:hypothetical protein CC78DRAFT_594689 [Lojkania enalia]|uniref:Uncharacterized protein n=1 Tax=Lojkania enalia TaxID=147567 RepID=A0A9P4KE21_9PLEO|nr:hypothetical protein CC78DRAFT_594689 [Didymosphaeria enalia]